MNSARVEGVNQMLQLGTQVLHPAMCMHAKEFDIYSTSVQYCVYVGVSVCLHAKKPVLFSLAYEMRTCGKM